MDDIRHALDGINSAWRERRFEDLAAFLDENVVMKGPAFKEFARGKRALVDSYVQFMALSRVTEFTESNHAIEDWGDTAAIYYDWTMTCSKLETRAANQVRRCSCLPAVEQHGSLY